MSSTPEPSPSIPAETARVARAAFRKGNLCVTLRDQLGELFTDQTFAALFIASTGRPAESAACLAWVSVLQFVEDLPDRQAAEAVRSRIDWKYLLGLTLDDPGFDFTLLADFRRRVLAAGLEQTFLDEVLRRALALGLLKARGRQRTDSTRVLAAIRTLNRLECIGETLRHTLNELSQVAPDWLRAHVPAEWGLRYGRRFEQYHLPKTESARRALAETIGRDGYTLLAACYAPAAPENVRTHPAIEGLRRVWLQNFYVETGGDGAGGLSASPAPVASVAWREAGNFPPAALIIQSPYDVEAHFSQKRDAGWVGYKGHVTETCDADQPYLLTHVATTPATQPDTVALAAIQADLAAKGLLPREHFVDTGYTTPTGLVTSQTAHQVELVGPVEPDSSWQARQAQGFELARFVVDWAQHSVTCPQGHASIRWGEHPKAKDRTQVDIAFAAADCQACPTHAVCTRSQGPRHLKLLSQAEHLALQAARQRQTTQDFKERYAARAGIESTLSQAVRRCGYRATRYVGRAKTHLQHILTAAAINLIRLADWFETPSHTPRRPAAFTALMAPAS
jgi:transposase